MLHTEIKEKVKEALKARDEVRLVTLRGIVAGCTNELVAQKRPPQELLSDEDVLKVIKSLAKQRKDSNNLKKVDEAISPKMSGQNLLFSKNFFPY